MEAAYIAVFDIGTTAIKGLLIDRHAKVFGEMSANVETISESPGQVEQNPEGWWKGVASIANYWWTTLKVPANAIRCISFSGQMEDVIPVDHRSSQQPNAILYSDHRAKREAEMINARLPEISSLTGNEVTATTP
ncbi:MAG TPA: FGGY family carbohydrate kinase, partial [Chondromyces sp.]|nr:FGGY family carbohydrate kinase [Chondromyces sp.]